MHVSFADTYHLLLCYIPNRLLAISYSRVCACPFLHTDVMWYLGGRMVEQGLDFWISMIKVIGPREQTGTTSLPSDSGCIMADALIRLVNILIELKSRTKLCVLGLSLYVSLPLWHAVCITASSLLLWFQNNVNSPRLWVTIGSAIVILATNRIKIELFVGNHGKY